MLKTLSLGLPNLTDISTSSILSVGRNGIVGITTRYGLEGPEFESRWARDFPHPSRPALEPIQLLYNGSVSRR
jgi:hypothetical protein